MAKEHGRIARLNKGYGFIERPDGSSLFFHFSKFPGRNPAVNDELDYEVGIDHSKPAGKQDYAHNITVTKKSPAAAPAPSSATPSTTPTADVQAEFSYGQEQRGEHHFEMPVNIVVTVDGHFQGGATVRFFAQGLRMTFPAAEPRTDAKGVAEFLTLLENDDTDPPLDTTRLNFRAEVTYQGQTYEFGKLWPPQYVQPAAPPPPPAPVVIAVAPALLAAPTVQAISAQPLGYDRDSNAYYYRVQTRSGTDPKASGIATTVVVVSSLNLEIGFVHNPGDNFAQVPNGEVTTSLTGLAVIGVRLAGSKSQRGYVQFAIKDNPDIHTEDLFVKTPLPAAP